MAELWAESEAQEPVQKPAGSRAVSRPKRRPDPDPGEYPGDHVHDLPAAPPPPPFVPGDAYEGDPPDPGPAPAKPRFVFVGAAEFASGDYRPEWLVPHVLVKGQPGVVAGPSKGMKTSLLIDLAVSMAAGRPFLGRFDVPRPVRVAVVSGESGEHTLQETATRVCKARGVDLASLGDRLSFCFSLPVFTDLAVMTEFADGLAGLAADVAFIDPVYLALGGGVDAANLFEMGAAFRVVSETLLKTGCTPVLVHHANRGLKTGEPMELQHMAFSGLEQFARQFILVNRRQAYQSDGEHDLWVRVGGSAGHGGLWAVHVGEGLTDEHFAGRRWDVEVSTATDVQADRAAEREAEKEEAGRRKLRHDEAKVFRAIDAERQGGHAGATQKQIQHRTGLSLAKVKDTLQGLLEDGSVEPVEFVKVTGHKTKTPVTGFRRVASGDGGNGGYNPRSVTPVRGGGDDGGYTPPIRGV